MGPTDTIGVPMASDREINCPSAGKSLSVYKEAVMSACT